MHFILCYQKQIKLRRKKKQIDTGQWYKVCQKCGNYFLIHNLDLKYCRKCIKLKQEGQI